MQHVSVYMGDGLIVQELGVRNSLNIVPYTQLAPWEFRWLYRPRKPLPPARQSGRFLQTGVTKIIVAIAMAIALIMTAAVAAIAESMDTAGFTSLNADGSFGPYETLEQPTLADQGSYTQSGELWKTLIDQYDNGYYLDLGPAPQPPQAWALPTTTPTPVPTLSNAQPQTAPISAAPMLAPRLQPTSAPTDQLKAAIQQVNIERAKAGLALLTEDHTLDDSARAYASYEAASRCYGHACPGADFEDRAHALIKRGFRIIGECIGWNLPDGIQMVDNPNGMGFMQSAPHKAILLNPRMTRIGIGLASGPKPTVSGPDVDGPMSNAMLAQGNFDPRNEYWVVQVAF